MLVTYDSVVKYCNILHNAYLLRHCTRKYNKYHDIHILYCQPSSFIHTICIQVINYTHCTRHSHVNKIYLCMRALTRSQNRKHDDQTQIAPSSKNVPFNAGNTHFLTSEVWRRSRLKYQVRFLPAGLQDSVFGPLKTSLGVTSLLEGHPTQVSLTPD